MVATSATVTIDPTHHLRWARGIARGVRDDYKFWRGSAEEQDLEAVAYLAVLELALKFRPELVPAGGDPDGQFRGWANRQVRTACQREAVRLRNAGCFRTRRGGALVVHSLPCRRALITGDRFAPGEHLLDDGRRPGDPEPLDLLIASEEEAGRWTPTTA